MDISDDKLRQAAKLRVARLFNVNPDALALGVVFGEELKASFVSDWKANEFDRLNDDIHDVADHQILMELGSGALVIRTVGDYCEHMVRCYKIKPKDVFHVLFRESEKS